MSITYKKFNHPLQLRGNQKDFNFQLHHRLSKFEVPVVVNLKHIFELFGLYTTCFLIQKLLELIRLSSDGQFWRKSQNKKGGKFELRSQLCYYNCTNHLQLIYRNLKQMVISQMQTYQNWLPCQIAFPILKILMKKTKPAKNQRLMQRMKEVNEKW